MPYIIPFWPLSDPFFITPYLTPYLTPYPTPSKGLARESGLHYAIMTGGDVAPLGKVRQAPI